MALRGSASFTSTRFGILNFASTASSWARIAASSTDAPSRVVTTAVTASPKSSCGRPITADSPIEGNASSAFSTSAG
jgi:hypothetical protein